MMNVIDNNDTNSLYQFPTFADQEVLSTTVFDNNNNIRNNMNNTMNNTMHNSMNNNMNNMNNMINNNMNGLDVTNCGRTALGSSQESKNMLLLKHIRGRTNRDFKELVANFWMPQPQSSDTIQQSLAPSSQVLKNTMPNNLVMGRPSSTDAFGTFHPIELSSNKNTNFVDNTPAATMDMRIPLENPSSTSALYSPPIDKNIFKPFTNSQQFSNNSSMGSSSKASDNTMMPPMTPSMSNFASSRRVSICNSSVISQDSTTTVKPSATDFINAATSIVNGNDFDTSCFNKNNSMVNNININAIPSNHNNNNNNINNNNNNNVTVVNEPGPYDIVCGRNSGAYNYIGNRRFRVTIEMNLQRYIDSPTREDKTNVIKSIVWMLHEQVGARFLKKETSKKSSGSRRRGIPRYTVMTDKQAREKVGHALRDLVITARKEQQDKKKPGEQGPKDVPQC